MQYTRPYSGIEAILVVAIILCARTQPRLNRRKHGLYHVRWCIRFQSLSFYLHMVVYCHYLDICGGLLAIGYYM